MKSILFDLIASRNDYQRTMYVHIAFLYIHSSDLFQKHGAQ